MDINDSLEIIIQGNDKFNFNDRIDDAQLTVLCSTLEPYAEHIDDIDLRYNEITDIGARKLGDLINKARNLMSLNLQGNKIKSEGAQYLAEALKECTGLQ